MIAVRAGEVRLRSPSLVKMLLKCRVAVRSLMNSRFANATLVSPSASAMSTSRSRALSWATGARSAGGGG